MAIGDDERGGVRTRLALSLGLMVLMGALYVVFGDNIRKIFEVREAPEEHVDPRVKERRDQCECPRGFFQYLPDPGGGSAEADAKRREIQAKGCSGTCQVVVGWSA